MKSRKKIPPKIAGWILSKCKFYEDHFAITDAIQQEYEEIRGENGNIKSWIWCWFHTLEILYQYIIWSIQWGVIMIKSYLKITFRNLIRYKGFSIINIAGLALSMAICLMIIIYIKDQKSSDQFHEKKDRITRVYTTDTNIEHSEVKGWATTPGLLGSYLRDNVPCVEDVVRLNRMGASVLKTETAMTISGMYVEPSFLRIFSFPLKDGDPETALNHPYSIIISEETAIKFFGTSDPINQTLTLENLGDFNVTGILRDLDMKSHFRFDALVSFATIPALEKKGIIRIKMDDWKSLSRYYTYVLLKEKNDRTILESQLPELIKAIFPEMEQRHYGFKVQPLLDINLGINLANGMPGTQHSFEYVFIPLLALLIIFLACFNYIILSIARSLKRTREIGLRKVIGATRNQVIKLFLSETLVVTSIALLGACFLILWLIPAFNGVDAIENSQLQINLERLKDPGLYLIFILFAIGVSVLAGLYPALYLSSFLPVNALQGVSRIRGFSRLLTRKILMVIQFAVSLTAIIFIVYFYQLYRYWLTYDRGLATENLVNVRLQNVNHEIFRNEMGKNSLVTGVSLSSSVPIYGGHTRWTIKAENTEEPRRAYYYAIDTDFITNYKIDIIAGRNFSTAFSTDQEKSVIINEQAVRALNLGSPEESLGKTILLGEKTEAMVIGIVKNFNFRSFENPIEPLVFRYQPEEFHYANIRYLPGKKEEMKTILTDTWKQLDKIHPVRYEFFEDAEHRFNSSISGTLVISAWACGFVILIALFGLLGMATYTTEMRVKEIGIRKVLGARVANVTYLLSKNYIRLILVSAAFALPAGYFLSDAIFQFFAFRPNLNLWVLPGALMFILVLALLTIGSQTLRAAHANPTETLRVE